MAAKHGTPPLFLEFLLSCTFIFVLLHGTRNPLSSTTTLTGISFRACSPKNFAYANTVNLSSSKHDDANSHKSDRRCVVILLILLSGDINMNPGPGNRSIFPCGVCDIPVNWTQEGVCCNNCSVWYHKSCDDLSSRNMSYIGRSSVIWHCCKCNSINVDSFTFNSFELSTSNVYNPLMHLDSTIDSITSSCFSPLHASSPHSYDTKKTEHHSELPTSNVYNPLIHLDSTIDSITSSCFSPLHASSPYSYDTKKTKHHSTRSQHVNRTPLRISSKTDNSTSTSTDQIPIKSANIRLLTVNCCSVMRNRSEFTAALEYIKPDLICGTESWLRGIKPGKDPERNCIKTSEAFPESLTVHRNDRSSGIGGGVFTASREGLLMDAQPKLTTDCEIVWSKVLMKNKKDLYLGSFYMPHRNLNDIKKLEDSITQLTQNNKDKHIILAGDMNCPNIDWETLTVQKGAADRDVQQALLDFSIEHNLTQVHCQPTRYNNLLDLVFTNNPSIVKISSSIPGISDHAMVVTDIDIIPKYIRQKPRNFFIFSKADWNNISKEATTLSDEIVSSSKHVQELWDSFKDGIFDIMQRNIPSKTSKKRKSVPWFNRDLKRRVKRKSRLYKHAKKTNQWEPFKIFQKDCKKAFKKAEILYINDTIQKGLDDNNTKPFWRYVKSRRQDSVGVAPLKEMGQLLNDSKDKAQILVDQFKSVFTQHKNDSFLPEVKKKAKTPIPPIRITTQGVEKLLNNINTSKATGPDKISNIMLKTCASQLAPALRTIFQRSIDTGKLPADWLNANVSPVFKKGDVHLPENYRPVSLTCVSCKLLEHIICKHILDHLEKNKILTPLNHGFRSGYSCETQLVTTVHDLLQQHDIGAQIDMAILDFSKAFDTVPHDKLLHKMKSYGVDGTINDWLRDFLTNRSMQVVVDGEESDSVTVDSGVPQGTVLGPLLFLCHINDLPDSVKSSVRLFADDCLLYRRISTIQDQIKLQDDLQSLEQWAETWDMRFNAKKCFIMSINQKKSHFYQISNHILQQVDTNPYLGVTFSDDLKWSSHITKITKKANSTLGFIKRNLKHCPESSRKTAYLALVRSTLEYSSVVWDPILVKDINKLEKVQRQAARFITGNYSSRDQGCVTKMLQDLDLSSLQDRRKNNRLAFFYKMVEGLVPAMPCHDFLTPVRKSKRNIKPRTFSDYESTNIIDSQCINNCKCFKPEQCNTDIYKHSFIPRTIIDWNHLEDSVVSAQTLAGFKTALTHRD